MLPSGGQTKNWQMKEDLLSHCDLNHTVNKQNDVEQK